MHNLSRLHLASARPGEALPLAQAALAAHAAALGDAHPWTRASASAAAQALAALGRADEAAELRARFGVEKA